MKVRWDFFFEARGFLFDKRRRFLAKLGGPTTLVPAAQFGIVIDPKDYDDAHAVQVGLLSIELPGRVQETEAFAKASALMLRDRIAFEHGGSFKLVGGCVMAEHLPETDAEAQELGDRRFYSDIVLEECAPLPVLHGSALAGPLPSDQATLQAMRHYAAAAQAQNRCDKLLGFVRILEELFGSDSKGRALVNALQDSRELFDIGYPIVRVAGPCGLQRLGRDDFSAWLAQVVNVRDHCAHLRTKHGLGIAHGDPRERTEVEPLLEPLRLLCEACIRARMVRV